MATPLSKAEIKEAFLQLNRQTSPRPNGFGPAYYQKVLSLLKPIILPTLELLSLAGQTKRLNQAHVVLAKKDSAAMPDSYRPISLQHCRIKAATKVLTTRLKPLMPYISIVVLPNRILLQRGMSKQCYSWIHILSACKTAIMLNGVPGDWINYKNGLHLGHPLPPCLFIIVADLLQ